MCGIAGVLRLSTDMPVDAVVLARMTGALVHRGPDDEGLFVSPARACGLGARRLSIIDLAGGHQPICNEAGDVWVVQNGEIYNYKPLRAELEACGHVFRSESDTEVIAHAYEQWGAACVERLWGMFALAVWDEPRQRLLLARDRLGKKPLFLAQVNGLLLFASEIKALLRHPALCQPTLDARSLDEMFTVGYVPGPATIWREISKLPPAHLLIAEVARGTAAMSCYWDSPYLPGGQEDAVDPEDAAEEVLALLQDAVRLRLQADVPVGALLSGGLDSSGLVALMQELTGGRAHTFSIGFDRASHDESQYARLASSYLGTEHHELRFGWEAFNRLPAVMASLDQPQCFATAVPISMLYEACRAAGFKVILTGEGSDELFAGYGWFRGNQQAEALLRLPAGLRRPFFSSRLPFPMSPAARQALAVADRSAVSRYLAWQQVSTAGQRSELFSADFRHELARSARPPLAVRWQDEYADAVAPLASLHRDMTLERHIRLPDFINHEVDAMSMAHSVEARVPFLDHRLWELLARWPPRLKLDLRRPEKWLLRDVFGRPATSGRPYLPPAIRERRKQGLATPHADWWRQPRMPAFVEEALSETMLRENRLFSVETVAELRAQHKTGQANHSALLTGVLNVQLWHQRVFDLI